MTRPAAGQSGVGKHTEIETCWSLPTTRVHSPPTCDDGDDVITESQLRDLPLLACWQVPSAKLTRLPLVCCREPAGNAVLDIRRTPERRCMPTIVSLSEKEQKGNVHLIAIGESVSCHTHTRQPRRRRQPGECRGMTQARQEESSRSIAGG